jgi:predicted dehydrogenase
MRLLIVGTGSMANHHADHFADIDGVELVGAVDVDSAKLELFADKHNIPARFRSLKEAIAWGKFDSATNVTPDKIHHPTTMQLLAAGKHVLCEKPLAENFEKAMEMTQAAEQAGVINMVNLTYRNVAPIQKAREMVLTGDLGTIRHVEASYLQSWLVAKAWGDWRTESQWLWRLSKKHGSNGVLGDVGIHILDFASYGSALDIDHVFCRLKTFHKAEGDKIGEYDLDANDSFTMSVDFNNGALGVIHATRWATGHLNELKLRIYGEKGSLEVLHTTEGSWLRGCFGADIETGTLRDIDAGSVPTNYARFFEAVQSGNASEPSFRHAANLQKILDLGLVSDAKRTELKV